MSGRDSSLPEGVQSKEKKNRERGKGQRDVRQWESTAFPRPCNPAGKLGIGNQSKQ